MSGPELEALYRQGQAVGIPAGRIRGTAILAPGTSATRPWPWALGSSGRVRSSIPPRRWPSTASSACRSIRAQVYQDQSWLDGAPALVLDYSRTSRVYAQNRDEIRQVAPGLFLGLMYARTHPQPTLRMYFALQTQP